MIKLYHLESRWRNSDVYDGPLQIATKLGSGYSMILPTYPGKVPQTSPNPHNSKEFPLQGGPLPVISGVITPISRDITPVTHLFSAIYRGPITPLIIGLGGPPCRNLLELRIVTGPIFQDKRPGS